MDQISVTLLLSIVMAASTIVIAYFAYTQNKLAKAHFKLATTDKRFAVYDALKEYISYVSFGTEIKTKQARELLYNTRYAQYVFPKRSGIPEYILKIYSEAGGLELAQWSCYNLTDTPRRHML